LNRAWQDWVIPEAVDPERYVEEIALPGSGSYQDEIAAHLALQFRRPLPAHCMVQAQLITWSGPGAAPRTTLLFRILHTAADAVVLTEVLNSVLCETSTARGSMSEQGSADMKRGRRALQASACERILAFIKGLLFLCALVFWPSDRRTALSLGPSTWKRRQQQGQLGEAAVGVGESVPVSDVKAAAKAKGVTINDLLLTALAGGLRRYLQGKGGTSAPPKRLKLTAVVLVNPRPQALQGDGASKVLEDFAAMRGQGCDITPGFVPLPAGEMSDETRLAKVAARMPPTRHSSVTSHPIHSHPAPHLLRLAGGGLDAPPQALA
jgi:hypothetical protein